VGPKTGTPEQAVFRPSKAKGKSGLQTEKHAAKKRLHAGMAAKRERRRGETAGKTQSGTRSPDVVRFWCDMANKQSQQQELGIFPEKGGQSGKKKNPGEAALIPTGKKKKKKGHLGSTKII